MWHDIQLNELEEVYLQHTDYHLFPGGRKRLHLIVEHCEHLSHLLGRRLKVLDVGCGNGSNSFPIASLGHHLVGIDVSADSIAYAGGINTFSNTRFLVHNLIEQSPPERFDVVICSEVLEHLKDPESLVRSMAEVLEPGGLLVITVPNGYGPREVLGRIEQRLRQSPALQPLVERFRRLFRMSSAVEKCRMHTSNPDQDHIQKFTPGQLKHLIEPRGLHVTQWVNPFWLFSLFGKAKAGTNLVARIDSWVADIAPAVLASGWYVVCEKADA